MHRPTAAVLGLVALGAAAAYAVPRLAEAQQATPPAPPAAGQVMPMAPMAHGPLMKHGPWMGHGEHRGPMPPPMMMMMMHRMHERMANWGLFYPTRNKHLTAADITTIAQAILVEHANHTWKVTDVTAPTSGPGSFAFAAKDGTVIAHFTIDLGTGHIRRNG